MSSDGEKYSVRNSEGDLLPPGTFFVVRGTDLFAAPCLWAYVHALETVIEFGRQSTALTDVDLDRLRDLADQATSLAGAWQASGLGRIPD